MEKGSKEPKKEAMPAEGSSLLLQNVYCVCFPQRDSLEMLQGELAAARRRYFKGGRRAIKVGRRETVKGFDGDLRGKLSRWGFYWKKTALGVSGQKGVALEEAFDQKGGYVLVCRDFRGVIVSRVFFSKDHAWQKSEYYEPWDPGVAKVMFKPDPMEDVVGRYDWDPTKKLYRSITLHPAPYEAGSAEQALINARFGEPPLIVALEGGQLCYCPQQEAAARAQALEEIRSGTMVLMPAWEIKEGAMLGDEDEEDADVTFTSLDAYAQIAPREKPAPPPPVQAEARDLPLPPPAIEPPAAPQPSAPPAAKADELDIEYILADAHQEPPAGEPQQPPAPVWEEDLHAAFAVPQEPAPPPPAPIEDSPILPVVLEAMAQEPPQEPLPQPEPAAPPQAEEQPYQGYLAAGDALEGYEEPSPPAYGPEAPADPPPPTNHWGYGAPPKRAQSTSLANEDPESASILSAARQLGGIPQPKRALHSDTPSPSLGVEDASILSAARQTGTPPPRRARQAAPPQPALGDDDTSILTAARQLGGKSQRHAQPGPSSPAPRHTVPGQPPAPPPQGLDRPRERRLSGKSRTEQPGGLTAYEGDYKDGKRQGFGSQYYKNGDLSYAGFWNDDKKDGLGASFREGDHALHVSRWVQGRPGQQVSLFDKEGSLRFGGRIVGGKKEGAGVSINSADGSVMVTKWVAGQDTGLASAFDPEGNLLYYGSWKNGKRHGHGTEFDKNGGIVFDGEWRDGQYFNGILYQKPAEAPPPPDPGYPGPDWDL